MKLSFKLLALALLIGIAVYTASALRADRPILLAGTVVTPETIIPDGWILIQEGRIRLVSDAKPDAPNAIEVNTGGIIFPGLIDLHNHISYDVFPRWHPPQLYSNHNEWNDDPDYAGKVGEPYGHLIQSNSFCDMNAYGELRALVGGTTSILATADAGCIGGLVRNLDHASGFYNFFESDHAHIRNDLVVRSTTSAATISSVRSFLADSRSEMFVVHTSEGVDAAALAEFRFMEDQALLTHKTVLIHGIALTAPEFQTMHDAGASLIWSPRSNVELYGKTADIAVALDRGVRVALAPDWAISGSSNMLDELHYATKWNSDRLSGRLSPQQLVEMVTAIPAQMAGIDDEVGTIREGLYADLLVISGDRSDPYQALTQATAGDVQLVLIGGSPVFGSTELMGRFWNTSDLSEANVDGRAKMIRMPNSGVGYDRLVSELQKALALQGTSLAPLTESR